MSISQRIRELRTARNLTQGALGELMLLTQQSIAAWENDRSSPSPDQLVALTRIFGVSADYLLGITDDPTPRDDAADRVAAAELIASGEAKEITEEQLKERLPEDLRDTVMALIKIEIEKAKKK